MPWSKNGASRSSKKRTESFQSDLKIPSFFSAMEGDRTVPTAGETLDWEDWSELSAHSVQDPLEAEPFFVPRVNMAVINTKK